MTLGYIEKMSTVDSFTFLSTSPTCGRGIYVAVQDRDGTPVLARVYDLSKSDEKTYAKAEVVGRYRPGGGFFPPFNPLPVGAQVRSPSRALLSSILGTSRHSDGMFVGLLRHHHLPVYLDADEMFTRHAAIVGASGSGKSLAAAVFVEELLDKGGAVVIIDPHGEYAGLSYPCSDPGMLSLMTRFRMKPRSYMERVALYTPDIRLNPTASQLRFDDRGLSAQDLKMPGTPAIRANPHQFSLLARAIAELSGDSPEPDYTLADIEDWLAKQRGGAKHGAIAELRYIANLGIFSSPSTTFSQLVQKGRATIVVMKGVPPDVQDVVVSRLCQRLFRARTQGLIPPLVVLVEEAHNFCSQRGERLSRRPIIDLVSEGRKFQLGVILVTQRPARVDKTALSQCGVLMAFQLSSEGDITAAAYAMERHLHSHRDELARLPVGSAVLTGRQFPYPLIVDVRPRRSEHLAVTKSVLAEV